MFFGHEEMLANLVGHSSAMMQPWEDRFPSSHCYLVRERTDVHRLAGKALSEWLVNGLIDELCSKETPFQFPTRSWRRQI